MADIYKIAQSWMGVWVHNGPGVGYPHVGVIHGRDNKEYEVSERKNTYWLKIGEGRWCCDRDSNGMMVMIKTGTTTAAPVKPEPEPEMKQIDEESLSTISYDSSMLLDDDFIENLENNFNIRSLRGIFGMPYQFMKSADPRLMDSESGDGIGRKYAKEVVANMPMLLLQAGKPVFMGGDKKLQKDAFKDFTEIAADLKEKITDVVLADDYGKYYTLEPAFNEYFEYVNSMCRYAARFMNLHNVKIDNWALDEFNWEDGTGSASSLNDRFRNLFSTYAGCTAWYCNSKTSISDSWSNGTANSMLADKINGLSDMGRELNFLLGTVKAETGYALDKFTNADNLVSNMENINNFVNSALGNDSKISGIFKSLVNSAQTVAAGGKLVFPEIWSDSNFSREYDIDLKLVSPDGDDLSVYLNIIVPILHLLAFTLPRESKSHGYISPFLVRGFYKGLFNVDMGIITSLSIEKGKEAAWSVSGIPTTVDVSFTIKDLYNDMYMSKSDNKFNITNNIILLDYIGNLCGININEPDISRSIDLFLTQNIKNKITDTWRMKMIGSTKQWISTKWQNIFGKF